MTNKKEVYSHLISQGNTIITHIKTNTNREKDKRLNKKAMTQIISQ